MVLQVLVRRGNVDHPAAHATTFARLILRAPLRETAVGLRGFAAGLLAHGKMHLRDALLSAAAPPAGSRPRRRGRTCRGRNRLRTSTTDVAAQLACGRLERERVAIGWRSHESLHFRQSVAGGEPADLAGQWREEVELDQRSERPDLLTSLFLILRFDRPFPVDLCRGDRGVPRAGSAMRPSSTASSDRGCTPVQWCERLLSEPVRTTVRARSSASRMSCCQCAASPSPARTKHSSARRFSALPKSPRFSSSTPRRPAFSVSGKKLRASRCAPAAASRRDQRVRGPYHPA